MLEYALKDDRRQTMDGGWDGGRQAAAKTKRLGEYFSEPLLPSAVLYPSRRLLSVVPAAVRRLPS
jgi:hypothetical protein